MPPSSNCLLFLLQVLIFLFILNYFPVLRHNQKLLFFLPIVFETTEWFLIRAAATARLSERNLGVIIVKMPF